MDIPYEIELVEKGIIFDIQKYMHEKIIGKPEYLKEVKNTDNIVLFATQKEILNNSAFGYYKKGIYLEV